MSLLPVVLAGGAGSRLWPLSRQLYPKQFLSLDGGLTMLQKTLGRLDGLDTQAPIVICNEEHRFLVAEQLRQIDVCDGQLLLEPVGRNTAPAIALAAIAATQDGDDPLLLVLAADHLVQDIAPFHDSIKKAQSLAERDYLVTFGVVPTSPETGYGYIHQGAALGPGFSVRRFVEKPDAVTATGYVESGEYLWNSGMFLFRASRYLEELERFYPDMLHACHQAMARTEKDLDFTRVDKSAFAQCEDISVDYAVMEKTQHAAVVPLSARWSDLGAWSSIWELSDKCEAGNSYHGDVIQEDTRNTMLRSESRLVAAIGLEDLVIIETKDAVLVADRHKTQDVKKIVERLKSEGRDEFKNHRVVYRPWGRYESVDRGQRYQVKRITVNPGAKLSVQMHHHRAEHWIVVSGTAEVTNGESTSLVFENESTYIPIGQVHALKNPGTLPLELIEVQSGSYLGEDDIVRFEDQYGRV
ncbi:mannose-1-phosphate guanylyltransferase/mannose-6-phosphate isomerase [Halomonas sp. SH5A2]|uniref:mannose-1-phosphate guanylyltransferase/mannose-6-phosphate isomerase n=1 Tax=Halomonas sp. SH5A2 TaxID=2749040 RepID=UPI0016402CEC|nr:mannose-1-phosphate guanylyltransferase/mannose-6-phosphate isomerase [Halomonas sp. SH5A2]QNI01472.1 mannose-1-phosphate guanylyltransferase/mannose-6-phosphate isomerase [Halomonas sp. SH5A2]